MCEGGLPKAEGPLGSKPGTVSIVTEWAERLIPVAKGAGPCATIPL